MKRLIGISIFVFLAAAVTFTCAGEKNTPTAAKPLKDGVYRAATPPDGENYYCQGTMKVEKGRIVSIEWEIRDKNRNDRLFDETYGPAVYPTSELYRAQCRENLAGMKTYGPRLIETQDLHGVDAVSGATWAHSQFFLLGVELLKMARR